MQSSYTWQYEKQVYVTKMPNDYAPVVGKMGIHELCANELTKTFVFKNKKKTI